MSSSHEVIWLFCPPFHQYFTPQPPQGGANSYSFRLYSPGLFLLPVFYPQTLQGGLKFTKYVIIFPLKRENNHIFSEFKPPLEGLGVKNREKKEAWGIKPKRVRISPPLGGLRGKILVERGAKQPDDFMTARHFYYFC